MIDDFAIEKIILLTSNTSYRNNYTLINFFIKNHLDIEDFPLSQGLIGFTHS